MRRLKILGSALVVALVLVTCADYASFAATGHSFLLGRANSAGAMTTLSRTTSGPALSLHTHASTNAPMTTNATGKVTHLNADRVDGYEGAAMLNRSIVFHQAVSASGTSTFSVTLSNVPAGTYQANANAWLYAPTAGGVICYLSGSGVTPAMYEWFAPSTSGFFTPHSQAVLKVPTTEDLTYSCYTNDGSTGTWTSYTPQPLQVALTSLSSVSTGSSSQARVANGRIAATNPAR